MHISFSLSHTHTNPNYTLVAVIHCHRTGQVNRHFASRDQWHNRLEHNIHTYIDKRRQEIVQDDPVEGQLEVTFKLSISHSTGCVS